MATSDYCDNNECKLHSGDIQVLAPVFRQFGKRNVFSGKIVTLKVFEDNSLVRNELEKDGRGKVLFVDGGGSLRCALLGGNLAALAETNGWSGLVVNGCIRDVDEINLTNVGVRALASHPVKSFKRGRGELNVPVHFAGVRTEPGHWCYADNDGIIVSKTPL